MPSVRRLPQGLLNCGVLELLQIEPGAEHRSDRVDDHHRYRFVNRQGIQRVAHLIAELDRQCVPLPGTVDRQPGDSRLWDRNGHMVGHRRQASDIVPQRAAETG